MKKLLTATLLIAVSLILAAPENVTAKSATLYFYYSALCPACKRFKADMPEFKKQYPGLTIRSFELLSAANRVTPANRRNMRLFVNRLKSIDRRLGGKAFIIETRRAYRLKVKKGIPYYMKKISQSTTLEKDFPTPAFILGNRAYAGYRKYVLNRALRVHFSR